MSAFVFGWELHVEVAPLLDLALVGLDGQGPNKAKTALSTGLRSNASAECIDKYLRGGLVAAHTPTAAQCILERGFLVRKAMGRK
jgi:hypothetical protein